MFWYVVGALAGGGAIAEGYRLVVKRSAAAHPGAAGKANPIAPPGVPQPGGMIVLPVVGAVDGDPLHMAARVLLTTLSAALPGQVTIPAVLAFQVAYNATNPPVPLKADGRYGAKTQAVVQGLIAPALAPPNAFGPKGGSPTAKGRVIVARPPIRAALPNPVTAPAAAPIVPSAPLPGLGQNMPVDVAGAANILAGLVALTKTSDPRVATFQAAWNLVPGTLHLAVDGKYGPSTQGALQAVLDWMGQGGTAPKNPFSAVIPTETFPGLGTYVEA